MKQKTESRETEREKVMTDMADKALRNYDQIVKTTLRIQEEASRCWTSLLTHSASNQDWQRPISIFASMANGVLPEAQKRMQEVLELAENNSRTSVELMKKTADAMQSSVLAERQARWMDVWATSLGAARTNVDAMLQMGSRAMDSWINYIQRNSEMTQAKTTKTS
jgi:hypothetical protein